MPTAHADAPPPRRRTQWLLTAVQEAPGHCLALAGGRGAFVEVSLRERIVPTALSVEHLHRSIAFDPRSALAAFSLTGAAGGEDAGAPGARVLARGAYDAAAGPPVQTFTVAPGAAPVERVRLSVLSNHGANHTCLYRLRVHGRRADS